MTAHRNHREHQAAMQALAVRIRERRAEWERAHADRRIPITDTVSRILMYDERYTPPRPRQAAHVRPALKNPGIFTIAAIARELGTTVGDLLGEPQANRPKDALTIEQRRVLRGVLELLWQLFDLGDPALAQTEEAHAQQ